MKSLFLIAVVINIILMVMFSSFGDVGGLSLAAVSSILCYIGYRKYGD
jgi:hypothetical protein